MKSTPPIGGLHDLGGLHRGLAEEAGDQLGAVDLDQLALREQAERAVDAGDQPGDGGLAGAGVAVEDQVPGDRRRPRGRPRRAAPRRGAPPPGGGSRPSRRSGRRARRARRAAPRRSSARARARFGARASPARRRPALRRRRLVETGRRARRDRTSALHARDPLADHAELLHHLRSRCSATPGTGSRGAPARRARRTRTAELGGGRGRGVADRCAGSPRRASWRPARRPTAPGRTPPRAPSRASASAAMRASGRSGSGDRGRRRP